MDKEKWLAIAEVTDAMRVVPRTVLGVTIIFAGWYIVVITLWYMGLPSIERTVEVSGFAGLTIPAVFGLAAKMTDFYLKTGRKWTSYTSDSD